MKIWPMAAAMFKIVIVHRGDKLPFDDDALFIDVVSEGKSRFMPLDHWPVHMDSGM